MCKIPHLDKHEEREEKRSAERKRGEKSMLGMLMMTSRLICGPWSSSKMSRFFESFKDANPGSIQVQPLIVQLSCLYCDRLCKFVFENG